ncbi:MAG: AAA family ATPase [Candidatus Thorarchaeota archaeon]
MTQFILALCGLPASGKSALADAIKKTLDFNVEIVRTDDWRNDEYYTDWVPEKEKPVREAALKSVEKLIAQGKSVIHDDTNYYTSMRHELFKLALKNKCGFTIIHVTTAVTTALQWNRERVETKIPDSVIEDISERFDNPGRRYLWDNSDFEVDMEMQTLSEVVPEIIEILENLEPAIKPKPRLIRQTVFEKLDIETRQVVSEFLKENPRFRGRREISIIRRNFLQKVSEKEIPAKDVRKLLWSELSELK